MAGWHTTLFLRAGSDERAARWRWRGIKRREGGVNIRRNNLVELSFNLPLIGAC